MHKRKEKEKGQPGKLSFLQRIYLLGYFQNKMYWGYMLIISSAPV